MTLVHDPKDAGAHEDWSRLARLSFDGPQEEMECSQHAIELLDLIEEVNTQAETPFFVLSLSLCSQRL